MKCIPLLSSWVQPHKPPMTNRITMPAFRFLVIFCISLLILSCGGGGGSNPPQPIPPVIAGFGANPPSITTGQSSTLSWSVTGAVSLFIDQGVGNVTGSISRSVSPVTTTTFTLTATNSAGSTTRTVLLTVNPPPAPDFQLSLNPSDLTLRQGLSGNVEVTITPVGGFSAAVTVSAGGGLPTGVVAAPIQIPAGSTQGTLILNASASAAVGSATVFIQGSGGGLTRTANLILRIVPSGGGLAGVSTSWTNGSPPELLGYKPFPADSPWYRDVSADSVDPDSDNIIADLVRDDPGTMLHPDFGSSLYEGAYVGHPYDVVAPSVTPMVHVAIGPDGYADESDPGPENAAERVPIPVPIPATVHVEGGFDHHIYLLDKEGYWLYELYHAVQLAGGGWQADQVTLWDLNDNTQRPWTWTSADQAGLSIFAGLVKYDEVQAAIPGNGDFGHAVRFTVMPTQEPFIPPATHPGGGNDGNLHSPKMGQRFRLKAAWLSAHASEFSPQCRVILRSLARYGMIVADTGGNLFIQGTQDARWIEDADAGGVAQLLRVPPQAFEVLAHTVEYTRENHPLGPPPTINAFTATPAQVASGGTATLSWSVTGASTLIISPAVGPVRGSSTAVRPAVTTTYTLFATNEYGRSRANVTVNVP
ncbi:MAG: hypothetical protein K4571_08130 [Deltaproteobacteria bacterium]